ncbi:MAG: YaaL family protein [Defluviitaleaceae bacterium]|nr:YaaL family protein [Defluviitaleaceae bacterium]
MAHSAVAPATGAMRKKEKPAKRAKKQRLSGADMEIVEALEAVQSDMEFLHNCFDHTTDAILVDSLVYELKAANLKHQYYLNLCKEKGIVHSSARGLM